MEILTADRRRLFRVSLADSLAITAGVGFALAASSRNGFDFSRFCIVLAAIWLAVGLVRQARALRDGLSDNVLQPRPARFGLAVAVAWRWLLLFALAVNCLAILLVELQCVQLPEESFMASFSWGEPLQFVLCSLSFAAVVTVQPGVAPVRKLGAAAYLTNGLVAVGLCFYAASILLDARLIEWLVHIAMSGIDSTLNQTGGRYAIDTLAEERRLLWRSTFAAVGSFVAIVAAVAALRSTSRYGRVIWAMASVVGMAAAAAYCRWYYFGGLAAISPDFAGAPFDSIPLERALGIGLGALLCVVGAYRAAATTPVVPLRADRVAFSPRLVDVLPHALLACGALYFIWESGRVMLAEGWWMSTQAEVVSSMLLYPPAILQAALGAVAINRFWRFWRGRAASLPSELPAIAPGKFVAALVILAALAVLAVFTLAGASFAFWLGPWYRW